MNSDSNQNLNLNEAIIAFLRHPDMPPESVKSWQDTIVRVEGARTALRVAEERAKLMALRSSEIPFHFSLSGT
jgi:hypothetical protein